VILISHDRYLLDACADRLWLVADATVVVFDGDLDDYRDLVLVRRHRDAGAQPSQLRLDFRDSRVEARRLSAAKREELAPLRNRIKAAEIAMTRFAAEIARIDAELASDLVVRDPGKLAALAKARAHAVDALARSEEDWLEASTAYEGAQA
jgi:ATP-binding cassette, subfamily F, member 3